MFWTTPTGISTAMLAATLIASPATAYADCGDPGQDPRAGPLPTVDQVVAASKSDVVTRGFTPRKPGRSTITCTGQTQATAALVFVVTDIVSAPANFAGVTVTVPGSFNQRSAPQHIVLADHGRHWLIIGGI